MRIKQLIKETMSLEKAMKKPAALWIQGLSEKEYKTFLKIIRNDFKRSIKLKQLKNKFPSLKNSENLLRDVEKLYEREVWKQLSDKEKEKMTHISDNFGKLTPILGSGIDRYELAKKAFDRIR